VTTSAAGDDDAPSVSVPLVSVIVPTFNRTRYLAEAVDSALAQTYRNIEVTIADDASQEDVASFVKARFTDPRVRYERNPVNLGMGPNTWGALARARGKYVSTVHDDDVWEPDFLSTLIPQLERDETLSVAYCDHAIIDEAGAVNEAGADANTRRWNRDTLSRGVVRPLTARLHTIPAAMGAVFRKSAVDWQDFPAEVGTHYDFWLAYLSARTGAGGWYEPRRLTRYRVHGNSETGTWQSASGRVRALRQSEFILRRQLADPAMGEMRAALERDYVRKVLSLASALVETGDPAAARALLRRARGVLGRPELGLALVGAQLPDSLLAALVSGLRRLQTHLKT
jgi:glycosyltransferase involved in cell wall biosynthesis